MKEMEKLFFVLAFVCGKKLFKILIIYLDKTLHNKFDRSNNLFNFIRSSEPSIM